VVFIFTAGELSIASHPEWQGEAAADSGGVAILTKRIAKTTVIYGSSVLNEYW
jgi:hypothetical protein